MPSQVKPSDPYTTHPDHDRSATKEPLTPKMPTLLPLLLCQLLRCHGPQLEGAAVVEASKLEAICRPAQTYGSGSSSKEQHRG